MQLFGWDVSVASFSEFKVFSEVLGCFCAYEGVIVMVFAFRDFSFHTDMYWDPVGFIIVFDVSVLEFGQCSFSEASER